MFKRLRETIRAYQDRDPAARSGIEIFLLYPGLHATIYHRIAHRLFRHRFFFLSRFVSQWSRFWTGIEIHPGATIGRRFVIDHGMGVVIGETTEIGDDVLLYQGVTLGGSGKERGKRHPTIGNNVMIGAGARVLGSFKVGDNSRIAAGAVVVAEMPPNSTAVGVPAQIVKVADERINYAKELDHIHTPDPVSLEIQKLTECTRRLEAAIRELEGKKDEDL